MEDFQYFIPEESGEMTLLQIANLRKIEQRLRILFNEYHYQEVMPPNFEYTELYTALKTGFQQEKLFQFINHEGKSIALRYDFTIPLARTYARSSVSHIARYSYYGKVFRKEKRHKGRRTESYQIGVELLGEESKKADLECLILTLKGIQLLSLKNVVLELGSANFFSRLCELVGEGAASLSELFSKKNESGLKQFIAQNNFSQELNQLIFEIPFSTDFQKLLPLVKATKDSVLIASLGYLYQLYEQLPERNSVMIDLGLVPAMHYYTGIIFKAYSDKVEQSIISGGRYDALLKSFDCEGSAIGFCCHMDNILKAIELEEQND